LQIIGQRLLDAVCDRAKPAAALASSESTIRK
jgi:hypothetical protein